MATRGTSLYVSIAAAAAVAVHFVTPVQAQVPPPCHPREKIMAVVEGQYHEAPVGIGLSNAGQIVELYASEGGTTWTILVTLPDGRVCMYGAGTDWEAVPQVKGAPA